MACSAVDRTIDNRILTYGLETAYTRHVFMLFADHVMFAQQQPKKISHTVSHIVSVANYLHAAASCSLATCGSSFP